MSQNNNQNQQTEQLTQEQINFALEFARTLQKNNHYLFNPMLANQFLKNLNMNPVVQNRNKVKEMIANPSEHEQALRRLSQFIYNTQMSYKRMNHYLADILTFDWYPVPINATPEDMKKPGFKKDYDAMCNWFDKFNVKKEFKRAMLKMSSEDGYFTYLREDIDGDLFLQEMPIDYCIIDSSWKYGYLYSFNMLYFQQAGIDINGFPKEFKTYYKNTLDMQKNKTYYPNIRTEMRNGQWAYWQQIKPDRGWVFKFHNHFASLIPPFLGVFLDFLDIPELKDMQNAKSELELYKIIMGTVPRNKEGRSGSKLDDFAISAESLGNFVQLVKNSLMNKYVDFKAVPLENLELFSFDEKTDKTDSLERSFNNISTQTGIDRALLNTSKPNASSIGLSKLVDAEYISRLYEQFSEFVTYHVNKKTKKYRFKIIFEGTIHDKKERQERALELAQNGIITPKLASSEGMSLKEFNSSMTLMKWLGYPDNLTPIQSSYTLSKQNAKDGGRPEQKEVKESGEITRDAGSNIRDEIE